MESEKHREKHREKQEKEESLEESNKTFFQNTKGISPWELARSCEQIFLVVSSVVLIVASYKHDY